MNWLVHPLVLLLGLFAAVSLAHGGSMDMSSEEAAEIFKSLAITDYLMGQLVMGTHWVHVGGVWRVAADGRGVGAGQVPLACRRAGFQFFLFPVFFFFFGFIFLTFIWFCYLFRFRFFLILFLFSFCFFVVILVCFVLFLFRFCFFLFCLLVWFDLFDFIFIFILFFLLLSWFVSFCY